jgi:hypothetical protein
LSPFKGGIATRLVSGYLKVINRIEISAPAGQLIELEAKELRDILL